MSKKSKIVLQNALGVISNVVIVLSWVFAAGAGLYLGFAPTNYLLYAVLIIVVVSGVTLIIIKLILEGIK